MTMLQVGDVLEGRYQIEAPIARGGMSTVYRCIDTRLARYVAAKVMDDKYAHDPIFTQRFKREAQSMAKLSHPCLVGVYDFSSQGEHIFLIMELITGGTLRELLAERGPMPAHAAAAVLRSVLTGLSVAHQAGMVHRDIKPDNVLINADHQVKLADFGLVRAASASTATSTQIVGTVSYLSPEQVTGDDISARSDVYSAGILLFELLTGQTPFQGDTQISHAYARLESDVPAPSSLIDGVPKLFDDLVATATARNPDERFVDATEFLHALDDISTALNLPEFTIPVPVNSAAHRASEQLSSTAHTDLFTTDINRPGSEPTARTTALPQAEQPHETQVFPSMDAHASTAAGYGVESAHFADQSEAVVSNTNAHTPTLSNRSKTGFIAWLITVLLFTAAVAVGAWWFGSGRYGEIPQVLGMEENQAVATIEQAGFSVTTSDVYNNDIEAHHSVGTNPASGERAVRGKDITVLISRGQPTVPAIPNTNTIAAYRPLLEERTLKLVTGIQEYSDTIPEGNIIRTDPQPGETVPTDSTVTVYTSKGAAPVNVPSLEDKESKDAIEELENLGLSVTVVKEFSPRFANDHVIETDPPAGTMLPKKSAVTLKVSTAIEVPDVSGLSESEAKKRLAKAGVTVEQVTRSTSAVGESKDTVVGTSPEAQSLLDPANSNVTLILVGEVEIPNVVGKTVKEAKQILSDAGFSATVKGSTKPNAKVYWQSPTSFIVSNSAQEGTEITLHAN
ncbi:Stk1 family PASTA domain-containing Ser/Thr kinase [Corynebacterium sp. sy039]|uniref:Stk1 family PASTA domain-containing Ser/Thr kinase n=1 Tax=Corynebacterium sp. sy039 TaxID=2599641 RepID=UPI0011B4D784|nr:Stk1 family PASTA domain-containing Ser/Thr kinase [Corynebacterium sp. sy039]QDZ42931.1 Stk1 family PASTA domain-containing Ser/Thr kinase [Corynebacterium sp. sy039]